MPLVVSGIDSSSQQELPSTNRKRQTKPAEAPLSNVGNPPVILSPGTLRAKPQVVSKTRNTLPFRPSPRIRIPSPAGHRIRNYDQRQPKVIGILEDDVSITLPYDATEGPIDLQLETLPFGTRITPKKASMDALEKRMLEIDPEGNETSHVETTTMNPTTETTETFQETVMPETETINGLKETTTPVPETKERAKRDAFRRFNSQRSNQPKSLVPIKILESEEEKVSSRETKALKKDLVETNEVSCASVQLSLLDANDNNPEFKPSNRYHFTVREDAMPGMRIGKVRKSAVKAFFFFFFFCNWFFSHNVVTVFSFLVEEIEKYTLLNIFICF